MITNGTSSLVQTTRNYKVRLLLIMKCVMIVIGLSEFMV